MDEAALTALKESIKKWERRAAGDHSLPPGADTCPLCKLYHSAYRGDDRDDCLGCPVSEKTGRDCCDNTPYQSYYRTRTDENARREVDFLKTLLPAEEAKKETSLTSAGLT